MSVRRSARAKNAAQKVVTPDSDNDEYEPENVGVKKKSRLSQAPRKPGKPANRRGKTRNLPEMPLDIFAEIFDYLLPQDLLNLARTTKTLRHMLMRRSARPFWSKSLSRIPELPPCPSNLSIPQFVRTAFEKDCQFCTSDNAERIFWARGLRCCEDCFSSNFTIASTSYWQDKISTLLEIIPTVNVSTKNGWNGVKILRHWLNEEWELVSTRLQKNAIGSEELARMKSEVKEHEKFLPLGDKWIEFWKQNHARELKAIREEREKSILRNLGQLGWEEELKHPESRKLITNHAFSNPTKPLTDRTWMTMAPVLVDTLEAARATRLREEKTKVVRDRMVTLTALVRDYNARTASDEIIPGVPDIFKLKDFKAITESPVENDVTAESFKDLVSNLGQHYEDWRRSIHSFLFRLIPSGVGKNRAFHTPEQNFDMKKLKLATTLFSCRKCLEPLSADRALEHQCLTSLEIIMNLSPSDEFVAACRHHGSSAWNYHGDDVSFHFQASNTAKDIITACGKDSNTITAEEMNRLDPRIECLRCYDESTGNLVMRWRAAILHDLDSHHDLVKPQGAVWRLVQDRKNLDRIAVHERHSKQVKRNEIVCKRCRVRFNANKKLFVTHNKTHEGSSAEDWFVDRDIPMALPPLAVRIRL